MFIQTNIPLFILTEIKYKKLELSQSLKEINLTYNNKLSASIINGRVYIVPYYIKKINKITCLKLIIELFL